MRTMQVIIKYIARVVLLFYSISAFSPTYLSAGVRGVEGLDEDMPAAKSVSIGIVWINILVSTFVFDDRDATEATDTLVAAGAQDDDMILIKKKRVVCRAKCQIKPILETDILPADSAEHPETPSREYEIVRDPLQQETGVYISLNAGLSPPVLLS